jgi:hypothetical protein
MLTPDLIAATLTQLQSRGKRIGDHDQREFRLLRPMGNLGRSADKTGSPRLLSCAHCKQVGDLDFPLQKVGTRSAVDHGLADYSSSAMLSV